MMRRGNSAPINQPFIKLAECDYTQLAVLDKRYDHQIALLDTRL